MIAEEFLPDSSQRGGKTQVFHGLNIVQYGPSISYVLYRDSRAAQIRSLELNRAFSLSRLSQCSQRMFHVPAWFIFSRSSYSGLRYTGMTTKRRAAGVEPLNERLSNVLGNSEWCISGTFVFNVSTCALLAYCAFRSSTFMQA